VHPAPALDGGGQALIGPRVKNAGRGQPGFDDSRHTFPGRAAPLAAPLHKGYPLRGRTPTQALREALGIEELPAMISVDEKEGQEWDAGGLGGRPEEGPRLDGEADRNNESAQSADDSSGDQITSKETHAA
jgi:hypothetical protein